MDPFVTLGVERRYRIDVKQVEQRHRDLSRALHPDKFAQAPAGERRVAIERAAAVNEAFRVLKNPQARAAALLASVGRAIAEDARAAPELLMEILELREALENAKASGKSDEIARLRAVVAQHAAHEEDAIARAFDGGDGGDASALDRARDALVKLKYLYRFLEEADAIED